MHPTNGAGVPREIKGLEPEIRLEVLGHSSAPWFPRLLTLGATALLRSGYFLCFHWTHGMHMRRFAHLLADLVGRHGLSAQPEATFTGRSGATHTVALAVPSGPALVLVEGDLTGIPVDNLALAALAAACDDLGATGLFIHTGPLTPAALLAAGDRIRMWNADSVAAVLGQTAVAEALGRPLPGLPFAPSPHVHTPTPNLHAGAPAPPAVATPLVDLLELETDQASDAATLVSEPMDFEASPAGAQALDVDLPASPAAHVVELTDIEPDAAASPVAPVPGLDYIELADHTPVLHLEEADGTHAEVAPAPADATEAPDVIPLSEAQPVPAPVPQPATSLADEASDDADEALAPAADPAEFAPITELLPPAFRDGGAPADAGHSTAPLLPMGFTADEVFEPAGERLRAPEGSRGLLPPRVTLDEAKAAVGDRLFNIEEAELILQPVHLFDYAVDLLKPGKLTAAPVTGRLQVNGTDRRVAATDPHRSDAALAHRVLARDDLTIMDKVLRVSPERAEQLATAWALETHAKTVNVTTDRADDSYLVVERKSVAPTSGQVHLTPLGLWHRPFWRLWGSNGHVDLDAVEGHVIDAELKTPNPDFLLVE